MSNKIMVSVAVITYGHERYIEQALDSILAQKVNFPYEIIIGEDHSPDNTRSILLDYKAKNPDLITLICRDENVGATLNNIDVYSKCQGDYIVSLEGDDYWIDEYKLQKQFDFLEANKKYIGVSHLIEGHDLNNRVVGRYPVFIHRDRTITIKDILRVRFFSATATMFRNIFNDDAKPFIELYTKDRIVGDLSFCIYLVNRGKVFVFADCMAVYRVRISKKELNYNSLKTTLQKSIEHIAVLNANYVFYNGRYYFFHIYISHLLPAFAYCFHNRCMKDFYFLFRTLPGCIKLGFLGLFPYYSIRKFVRMALDKVSNADK